MVPIRPQVFIKKGWICVHTHWVFDLVTGNRLKFQFLQQANQPAFLCLTFIMEALYLIFS
jgi:hypothetical protein